MLMKFVSIHLTSYPGHFPSSHVGLGMRLVHMCYADKYTLYPRQTRDNLYTKCSFGQNIHLSLTVDLPLFQFTVLDNRLIELQPALRDVLNSLLDPRLFSVD